VEVVAAPADRSDPPRLRGRFDGPPGRGALRAVRL